MKMVQITRLPGSPDVIEGIINLRGKVIPVMDIRMKMHLPRKEYDSDTRIIVTETKGETVGMIVDSVAEVLRMPASLTEPPPDTISGIDSRFVSSIGKLENKMLILIDVEQLMGSREELAAP
jgi:purine-binding chemotaxis protein CheW